MIKNLGMTLDVIKLHINLSAYSKGLSFRTPNSVTKSVLPFKCTILTVSKIPSERNVLAKVIRPIKKSKATQFCMRK